MSANYANSCEGLTRGTREHGSLTNTPYPRRDLQRQLSIVTLSFGLSWAEVSSGARELIWNEARRRSTPDALRAYAAHIAPRQVDWSIRHRTAEMSTTGSKSHKINSEAVT